jgi:hypothetical protein
MTNEQTAVMLGGVVSEIESCISRLDVDEVPICHVKLIALRSRLRDGISTLKGFDLPVFTSSTE